MKNTRLILIIIIVLIASLPIVNVINFLIPQEKIETWLGVLGLFTTFGGAYLGAKIAGSESRKLFKQEMKMNDLQQHMDVNISILEDVEKVRVIIKKIETQLEIFQSGNFLEIKNNFNEMQKCLNILDEKRLTDSSIIIYHDVFQLKKVVNNQSELFESFFNDSTVRRLISNHLDAEITGICRISSDKVIYEHIYKLRNLDDGGEIIEIPIIDLIDQNPNYFKEEFKKLKNSIKQIKTTYKNMTYKNVAELKNNFVILYKD